MHSAICETYFSVVVLHRSIVDLEWGRVSLTVGIFAFCYI